MPRSTLDSRAIDGTEAPVFVGAATAERVRDRAAARASGNAHVCWRTAIEVAIISPQQKRSGEEQGWDFGSGRARETGIDLNLSFG